MNIWPFNKLASKLTHWLTKNIESDELPASDFDRICYEIKPCDVILVEGKNRISEIIKLTTKSNWSHAALYIGRLHEIKDENLQKIISKYYQAHFDEPLIVEGILGKGVIVNPLSVYKNDHVRLCRPSSITMEDAQKVISFAIHQLGTPYNVRHIFDLLRLLFPFTFIPRYLFSSIFKPYNPDHHQLICSSLLAEAFGSVHYPILPKITRDQNGKIQFIPRNPRLFTPKDFDYSPYFDIIKYPFYGLHNVTSYRQLPWVESGYISNDSGGIVMDVAIKKWFEEHDKLPEIKNEEKTIINQDDSKSKTN